MFDNQESPRDVRRVQRGAGRGRVPVAGLEGHRHLQEEAQEYPCTGKAFTWIFKQRRCFYNSLCPSVGLLLNFWAFNSK